MRILSTLALCFPFLAFASTALAAPYTNKIPTFATAPTIAYTEICFKAGTVGVDSHPSGGSTAGGHCLPGNLGYVIEQEERAADTWTNAMVTCLAAGWRMPIEFEWFNACENDGAYTFDLTDIDVGREWAGDTATISSGYVQAATSATDACFQGRAVTLDSTAVYEFRCVK